MKTCLECEKHKVIEDPDLNDSFNYDDRAVVCTLLDNPRYDRNSQYVADRQNYRTVTVACRPYRLEKESEVPEWCPLDKTILKVYDYAGEGMALGSEAVVIAFSIEEARELVYEQVTPLGLEFSPEDVKFREHLSHQPQVIHFWSGEY